MFCRGLWEQSRGHLDQHPIFLGISACLSPTGHMRSMGRGFVPTCPVLTLLPWLLPSLRLPWGVPDHSLQTMTTAPRIALQKQPMAPLGPRAQPTSPSSQRPPPTTEGQCACPASPHLPSCSHCSQDSGRPQVLLPSHSRSRCSFHPGSPSCKPIETELKCCLPVVTSETHTGQNDLKIFNCHLIRTYNNHISSEFTHDGSAAASRWPREVELMPRATQP